jgi:hypothetical protein
MKQVILHGFSRYVSQSLTLDFIPENDIPSVVPVWVHLPYLPLHYWNDDMVQSIGNALGKYIYRAKPRDGMQAYAHICVEVDLKNGLPEVVHLTLDNRLTCNKWTTINFPSSAKLVTNMATSPKTTLKHLNPPHRWSKKNNGNNQKEDIHGLEAWPPSYNSSTPLQPDPISLKGKQTSYSF